MVGTDSYVVQARRFDVCPGDIRQPLVSSLFSFDNSRVLSPWCSITLGSLKKDLLSLPCLFEQLTIAQKAGMIISAYQSITIHSGKSVRLFTPADYLFAEIEVANLSVEFDFYASNPQIHRTYLTRSIVILEVPCIVTKMFSYNWPNIVIKCTCLNIFLRVHITIYEC
jgi:hypothetical protein